MDLAFKQVTELNLETVAGLQVFLCCMSFKICFMISVFQHSEVSDRWLHVLSARHREWRVES